MNDNNKMKCTMKGCNNERYYDKYVCEKHWKERRKKPTYKTDCWEK